MAEPKRIDENEKPAEAPSADDLGDSSKDDGAVQAPGGDAALSADETPESAPAEPASESEDAEAAPIVEGGGKRGAGRGNGGRKGGKKKGGGAGQRLRVKLAGVADDGDTGEGPRDRARKAAQRAAERAAFVEGSAAEGAETAGDGAITAADADDADTPRDPAEGWVPSEADLGAAPADASAGLKEDADPQESPDAEQVAAEGVDPDGQATKDLAAEPAATDAVSRGALALQEASARADAALRAVRLDEVAGEAQRRPFRFFCAAVTTLSVLYFLFVAQPLYVSESKIAISGQPPQVPAMGAGLGAALPQVTGGLREDAALVEFIQSHEMLNALDESNDLRAAYSAFRRDPFRNMSSDASPESFLSFYRRLVTAELNTDDSIVTVKVRDFTPARARSLAEQIIGESSVFVERLNEDARAQSIRQSERELEIAQERYDASRGQLADWQRENSELDPTATGQVSIAAIARLQGELSARQTQLARLRTFSRETAPAVKQLAAEVVALEKQITQEKGKVQDDNVDEGLSERLFRFQALRTQLEIATQNVTAAEASLIAARSAATQQERYIQRIVNPNMPVAAIEPKRTLGAIGSIAIGFAFYTLISLMASGLRDHR